MRVEKQNDVKSENQIDDEFRLMRATDLLVDVLIDLISDTNLNQNKTNGND